MCSSQKWNSKWFPLWSPWKFLGLILSQNCLIKNLILTESQVFYYSFILFIFSTHLVSACNMDLRNFPIDTQNCSLTFGSCKYIVGDVTCILTIIFTIYSLLESIKGKKRKKKIILSLNTVTCTHFFKILDAWNWKFLSACQATFI